jgi:hypothetical protein
MVTGFMLRAGVPLRQLQPLTARRAAPATCRTGKLPASLEALVCDMCVSNVPCISILRAPPVQCHLLDACNRTCYASADMCLCAPAGARVTASLSNAVNAAAVAERPATTGSPAIDTTKTPKQLGFTMPGVTLTQLPPPLRPCTPVASAGATSQACCAVPCIMRKASRFAAQRQQAFR